MPLDAAGALALLKKYSDWSSDPALTEDELNDVLGRHVLAVEWGAATAYTWGTVVQPTTRNGHRYKCIRAGTSGASEPDWLLSDFAILSDGSGDLLWQEEGLEHAELWDLRSAAAEAWLLKAGKVASRYDFGDAQQSFKRDQLWQHCMGMVRSFNAGGFV